MINSFNEIVRYQLEREKERQARFRDELAKYGNSTMSNYMDKPKMKKPKFRIGSYSR